MSSFSDSTQQSKYATEFLNFLNASKSSYRAVENAKNILEQNNFVYLPENCQWCEKLEAQGGSFDPTQSGFVLSVAHVDSPCLKVKPNSCIASEGMLQVGVELYGGGIWHTWFDRDLGISGKVMVKSSKVSNGMEGRIIEIDRALMKIPNLAIHLTSRRLPDEGFTFNKEDQLIPIIQSDTENSSKNVASRHHTPLLSVIASELNVGIEDILDFDLSLTDNQPSCLGGAMNEFVFGGRLDNLFMSWTCIQGLLDALEHSESLGNEKSVWVVALFDNEEVGSETSRGAYSNLLSQITSRIVSRFSNNPLESICMSYSNSLILSCDMAHAVHPNYSQKHERNHKPLINHGLVIKVNSNARYANSLQLRAIVQQLAQSQNIPIQHFVVRNDSPCGSTIGPILSTKLGMRCIDIGAPQYSMHSIREMAGVQDLTHSIRLISSIYTNHKSFEL